MQLFTRLLRRPQSSPSLRSSSLQPPSKSLTSHLLASAKETEEYKAATQAPFLLAAAEGRLSKEVLGTFLAGEKLFFRAVVRAAGRLLAAIEVPMGGMGTAEGEERESYEGRLVDWVVEEVGRVRVLERRVGDVVRRYGIEIGEGAGMGRGFGPLPVETGEEDAAVDAAEVSSGMTAASHPTAHAVLPWLEAAVMFWATERCHLDAWSWAKAHQPVRGSDNEDAGDDADGGAMRKEFIPSWSSDEFREFVARLALIIDGAVDEAVEKGGGKVREEIVKRVEGKFRSLIIAEASFWPVVE